MAKANRHSQNLWMPLLGWGPQQEEIAPGNLQQSHGLNEKDHTPTTMSHLPSLQMSCHL